MMSDSPRPYRSTLREQRAAATRLRVVRAAVELFSHQGYAATTFAQLARAAGVSVETVRKHGPKSALLRAALELASFGVEGETDFFATDLGRATLRVRDRDAHAHPHRPAVRARRDQGDAAGRRPGAPARRSPAGVHRLGLTPPARKVRRRP